MASNYTEHLGLCQWEATDQVLREEFNEDNSKIDAVLGELQSSVASNTAALAKTGTLRFDCFSYIGSGVSPNSRTYPHKPLMLIIQSTSNSGLMLANIVGGCALAITSYNGIMREATVTVSGNTVTIEGTGSESSLNNEGVTYWVFAMYQEE